MSDLHVDPAEGEAPESYGSIARAFGVDATTVARLARGRLRAAVEGPIEGRDYPTPHRPRPGWTAA